MYTKRYKKEIEAVFFDGATDAQKIADWCGGMVVELVDNDGRLRTDMFAIDIPNPQGFTTAGKDFYVFKDSGIFYAVDKPTFESMFEEIDG